METKEQTKLTKELNTGNRTQFDVSNLSNRDNEFHFSKLFNLNDKKNFNDIEINFKSIYDRIELDLKITDTMKLDLKKADRNFRMVRMHSNDLINSVNFIKINDKKYDESYFDEVTREAYMKDIIDFGFFDISLKDVVISLKPSKKTLITFFETQIV
jgi:hypothetical protein